MKKWEGKQSWMEFRWMLTCWMFFGSSSWKKCEDTLLHFASPGTPGARYQLSSFTWSSKTPHDTVKTMTKVSPFMNYSGVLKTMNDYLELISPTTWKSESFHWQVLKSVPAGFSSCMPGATQLPQTWNDDTKLIKGWQKIDSFMLKVLTKCRQWLET